MSRHDKAMVIGLGAHSDAILALVQQVFRQQQRQAHVDVLWLAPEDAPEAVSTDLSDEDISLDADDDYRLPLDSEALNHLFFENQTRIWSGPNWQTWGQALASNRMYGKLAVHHHLAGIYNCLLARINQLSTGETGRLYLYLVAHAHDPFASGMVLDVAYLLHKLAMTRRASVYGMILLPGMNNDPLATRLDDESDYRLAGATAYALLRELHQMSARRSFYRNHHPDIVLDARHMSPFQTGDCYLIGGEQKEPSAPLNYGEAREDIARWIYLQTATAMGDFLPKSDNNISCFSSFGVVPSDRIEQPEITGYDAIARLLVLRLLGGDHSVDAFESTVERWLSVSQMEQRTQVAVPVSAPETDNDESENVLQVQDALYRDAVNQLRQAEVELARDAENSRNNLRDQIHAELKKMRQHEGMTLERYATIIEAWQTRIDRIFREGERRLQDLRDQAGLIITELRQERSLYAYQLFLTIDVRVFTGVLVAVGGLVALLLLLNGLLVQMIFWLLVPGVSVTLPFFVRNRRVRLAQRQFVALQQDLLRVQSRMMKQRVYNAHYSAVRSMLNQFIQMPGSAAADETVRSESVNRVTYLRDLLRTVLDDYLMDTDDLPEINLSEIDYARRLLDMLWNAMPEEAAPGSQPDLTPEQVLELIDGLLSRQILRLDRKNRMETFQEVVNDRQPHLAVNLAVNVNRIPQAHQHLVHVRAGVANWGDIDTRPEIQSFVQALGMQVVRLYHEADDEDGGQFTGPSSAERQLVLLRLRRNIPLHTLLSLERWQLAYRQLMQVTDREQVLYFASFFHPMRAAVAGLDIRPHHLPFLQTYPNFVQMLVMLLHHQGALPASGQIASGTIRDLAQDVQVGHNPVVQYDELAGALNRQPGLLQHLIERAGQAGYTVPDYAPDPTWHGWLQYLIADLSFSASEQFADWEVWALDELRRLGAQTQAQPMLHHLAKLVYHLHVSNYRGNDREDSLSFTEA